MDRTYLAVRRQLKGMNAHTYELGIRDAVAGKMILRSWQEEEILKSVPWLKRMNSKGQDIYIRPSGSIGLILLDDIGRGTIEKMKTEGFSPAAVIETSPLNFQTWVRISIEPVEEKLATQIAKIFAHRYGGDTNSADWRHFGRLAGFTNRKPQYAMREGYPFVLAHECNGDIAISSDKIILEAHEKILATQTYKKPQGYPEPSKNQKESHSKIDPVEFFQQRAIFLLQEYQDKTDYSRLDWMVVKQMLYKDFTTEEISLALEQASPQLQKRKTSHVHDYIERTIKNALQAIISEQLSANTLPPATQ